GHPADVMDFSFSLQAMAAEWLAKNAETLEPRIYTLPKEIDAHLARIKLEALGGGLETLTSEQVDYLSSWDVGT
ncbi:MAG: adenosylhomocysteinase, partial [Acidimicrobiia bacterium]